MGKKIKLDMSDTIKRLEEKDKKDPYWGTGGSKGVFNVDTMKKLSRKRKSQFNGKSTNNPNIA
jgi:hypothetical protein